MSFEIIQSFYCINSILLIINSWFFITIHVLQTVRKQFQNTPYILSIILLFSRLINKSCGFCLSCFQKSQRLRNSSRSLGRKHQWSHNMQINYQSANLKLVLDGKSNYKKGEQIEFCTYMFNHLVHHEYTMSFMKNVWKIL